MAITAHLSLALIEAAQAQKEVTANTAFVRIDALLNTGAHDKDLATPPASPAEGDVYIVAPSPTGAWAGQALKLAYFSQAWQFITPREGLCLWVNDEDCSYCFNGTCWVPLASSKTQAISAAATTSIDLRNGTVVELAQATDITSISFSQPASAGRMSEFTLISTKDNSGTARAITWPASVDWPSGSAPALTQTANAVDIFRFMTVDGGTRWFGRALGLAMA